LSACTAEAIVGVARHHHDLDRLVLLADLAQEVEPLMSGIGCR